MIRCLFISLVAFATLFAASPAILVPAARGEAASVPSPEDNLFLSDNGTRVVDFSSEYGSGWEAANLTPSKADIDPNGSIVRPLIWSSAPMAEFPHWLLFEFSEPRWATSLVFDNYIEEEPDHPGISAKDIEIWVGEDPDHMNKAAGFLLEKNKQDQAVKIEPVQTRYIKIVIASNYGHPWYTELGATRAFDDGTRPDDFASKLAKDGAVDLYGMYFDTGSAKLRPESDAQLDAVAAYAKANSARRLMIEGHTDSVGGDAANLALSSARAGAVKAALVDLGVPAASLDTAGYGEERPVATNDTAIGRAANRRVSLRLLEEAP